MENSKFLKEWRDVISEVPVESERIESWSAPYFDCGAIVQSNGLKTKIIFTDVQVMAIKQLLIEVQLLPDDKK